MKAAVIEKPGVIVVKDVPTPKPAAGEALLKIEACALCGTDQRILTGQKKVDVAISGHEITATVAEVGAGVSAVKKGDRVIVQTVIGCGRCPMCKVHRENLCERGFTAIGYQYNGGFAEYMIMPRAGVEQGCLIPIPRDLPADVGTLIEPLSCCVNGMKHMPLETTDHIVIFGGGIIGVLNGLVARARGARTVTIVDVSPERLLLLRKLGLPFDNLVNSRETPVEEWVKERTDGRGCDAVVIAASFKSLAPVGLKMLRRGGHLSIFAGMPKSDSIEQIDLNIIHYFEINVHGANSSAQAEYLTARDYIVSGKIDGKPLVTHKFSLAAFNDAVKTQANPALGSLKVIIVPS